MIHPFNIKLVISILYIAIGIIVMLYYAQRHDQFMSICLVFGALWPIVLFFEFLTYTLQAHEDRRIYKQIKNKAHFFETYRGKIHPDLQAGVHKEPKRKIKRRGDPRVKKTPQRNV